MTDFIFLGSKITAYCDFNYEIKKKKKKVCSLESYAKPRQHIKKQRHHFANKGLYSQSCRFSSGHVRMRELDHKDD